MFESQQAESTTARELTLERCDIDASEHHESCMRSPPAACTRKPYQTVTSVMLASRI